MTATRVTAGQKLVGATIGNNDQLYVLVGGETKKTIVGSGGYEYLSSGTAIETHLLSGGNMVISGGIARGVALQADAFVHVSAGGIASDIFINQGNTNGNWNGEIDVGSGGSANKIRVEVRGTIGVNSGGVVTNIVEHGSEHAIFGVGLNLNPGGVASNAVMSGYGRSYDDGTIYKLTLTGSEPGSMFVAIGDGGAVIGLTIDNDAFAQVAAGTHADNVVVNSGGTIYLSAGGTINNLTLNAGGTLVNGGGTINGLVNDGGTVKIGGDAYDAISASLAVASGGVLSPSLASAAAPSMLATQALTPVSLTATAALAENAAIASPIMATHSPLPMMNPSVHLGGMAVHLA